MMRSDFFQRSLELDSSSAEVWSSFGNALIEAGHFESAVKAQKRAVGNWLRPSQPLGESEQRVSPTGRYGASAMGCPTRFGFGP